MTGSLNPSGKLAAAIESLYATFGGYRLRTKVDYSPHTTITEADERALHGRPLRELTARDLALYSMKALTTWGDEDDLRHFLPRMLELVAIQPGWTDVPTVFLKLTDAEWRSWPLEEQRAIERYFGELWNAALLGEIGGSLWNLANGASYAGIALKPLVEAWQNTPGLPPILHIAYIVALERDELLRTGSFGHPWSDEARAALNGLVRSPDTRKKMEEAFFQIKDPTQSRDVSDALGVLEVLADSK
jgi:hypothetical protein